MTGLLALPLLAGSCGAGTAEVRQVEAASGPVVSVRIKAVQTPVTGGPSQETPLDQRVGILGLTLLKGPNDPSPLAVLTRSSPIDVPYNAGCNTLLGSVPASTLAPGTYTLSRLVVSSVKFTVAGSYHLGAMSVPGEFTDVVALTAGTSLDGATRDRGWWSSSFAANGTTMGQTSGDHAVIARPGASSRIALDLHGPVAAYVSPVDITIPPSIARDMELLFTVDTYQDFHWQDETDSGYRTGVFDVSDSSFEPVTQLGANSFTVSFGPVSSR